MTDTALQIRTPRQLPRTAGFTLIEMMAVIAIIGMIFAIGVPRLSSSRWRALGNAGESIAASLEYARQRAVMTGVPHRVFINLEDGGWRVEWLVREDQALAAVTDESSDAGAPGHGAALGAQPGGKGSDDRDAPIDLHPPVADDRDYHPIPNRQLGSFTWLDEQLYFVGLESASGWIEGGNVQIVFEADGTTEHTLLEIADADERHMTLEIEPLLDRIRRRDGTARS